MEDRDWIDRSVGRDEDVAFLWTGTSNEFTIWENEIFSRTHRRHLHDRTCCPGGLAQTPVSIDRGTGYVRGPDGRRVLVSHVLTDATGEFGGTVVGEDGVKRLVLYRVDGPLRQVAFVDGLYPQDTWSGKHVTYTRHDVHRGRAGSRGAERRGAVRRAVLHGRSSWREGRRPRAHRPAPDEAGAASAARVGGRQVCRALRGRAHGDTEGGDGRREPGPARARPPLQPLRLPSREDRLRRVAALASAIGDRHVPPRVAGRVGGGRRRRARDRRLRAHEPAGEEGDPGGARGRPRRASRSSSFPSRTSGARGGAASAGPP